MCPTKAALWSHLSFIWLDPMYERKASNDLEYRVAVDYRIQTTALNAIITNGGTTDMPLLKREISPITSNTKAAAAPNLRFEGQSSRMPHKTSNAPKIFRRVAGDIGMIALVESCESLAT